jgi:hypothetical protein
VGEVIKSYWHRLAFAPLYFYRDRDGREIDLLLSRDGMFHPIEIKRSASPRPEWAGAFAALDRLGARRRHGAIVCLAPEAVPLTRDVTAVPAGWL